MPAVFPHIGNDSFPHLDTAQPFRRTVPFDYERYDYTSTIKLCRVPWPMDYSHVVAWQSAQARDDWFSKLSGHIVELASGFTRTQTDSVRVNVPYDVALTYDYVYMAVPQLTKDDPIHHETADGVRVVCAWIQEAVYYAPSSTELILSLDYWTTYLPHLVPSVTMMLHRGHAPAYAVDIDEYLADPKANCANLLTPDVSFGTSDVCASARLVDIADGEKFVVLASTIPYGQISGLTPTTIVSGSSTPASYYDTGARDGHQVGVSDYAWHYGGYAYEGMDNPTGYQAAGNALPSYVYLYAIPSSNAPTALATLATRLPNFISSIQAAYVMPRRALVLSGTTYTVAGVTLYRIVPTTTIHDLDNLELSKEDFGYPARYANIAKLYTSPYARLVVSDCLGAELYVSIEDMGAGSKICEQVSPMMECLRWDLLLAGVNDAGSTDYRWTALDGSTQTRNLPGADVARYTLPLDIPTYALYLEAGTVSAMSGYADAQAQRAGAIVAYQSTMRSANTGEANAYDSAETAETNAYASADTAETNAYATANTSVTNTANSGSTAQANAVVANNLRTTSTSRNNTAQSSLNADAVQNIYDSSNADLEYTEYATDINLKSEAVASIQNLVGNAAAGNVMGALNAGVSGIVNITTSGSLALLSLYNILDHQGIAQSHANTASSLHIANATDQAGYANTANTNTTNNNVSLANTNATNNANTAKANATRTKTVSKGNATRTADTSEANSTYSRATSETNAKAALEQARASYVAQNDSANIARPVSFGIQSGDHSADALQRRVCQVRIETQSKSAIARAGDAMLRYGYIFDGIWIATPASWCPAGHDGCYWEATDVMLNASYEDNATVTTMFDTILKAGVTIWSNPDKIGGLPW